MKNLRVQSEVFTIIDKSIFFFLFYLSFFQAKINMMMIYKKIIKVLESSVNKPLTRKQIIEKLQKKFKINPDSVIPSDYCYNRINDGIKWDRHIFHYEKNLYTYLGANFPYTGKIYHRRRGEKADEEIGEWKNGTKTLFGKRVLNQSIVIKTLRQSDIIFTLFHSKEQIYDLISRADDDAETKRLISKFNELKKTRVPFYLNLDEFDEILHWKLRGQYNRISRFIVRNKGLDVKDKTQTAFAIQYADKNYETELRLKMLIKLSGVQVPVASAILTLCYPEKYSVLDFRCWRQIFGEVKKNPNYTPQKYIAYLSIIKQLATKFGVTPQEIDMAIWQHDIEMNSKRN